MARYYFHLVQGDRRVQDYKGTEFDSLETAKRGVQTIARDLLVEKMLGDEEPDGRVYEIADSEGRVLTTVHFSDVLPPTLKT